MELNFIANQTQLKQPCCLIICSPSYLCVLRQVQMEPSCSQKSWAAWRCVSIWQECLNSDSGWMTKCSLRAVEVRTFEGDYLKCELQEGRASQSSWKMWNSTSACGCQDSTTTEPSPSFHPMGPLNWWVTGMVHFYYERKCKSDMSWNVGWGFGRSRKMSLELPGTHFLSSLTRIKFII